MDMILVTYLKETKNMQSIKATMAMLTHNSLKECSIEISQ
jgi:hypothetical protein